MADESVQGEESLPLAYGDGEDKQTSTEGEKEEEIIGEVKEGEQAGTQHKPDWEAPSQEELANEEELIRAEAGGSTIPQHAQVIVHRHPVGTVFIVVEIQRHRSRYPCRCCYNRRFLERCPELGSSVAMLMKNNLDNIFCAIYDECDLCASSLLSRRGRRNE